MLHTARSSKLVHTVVQNKGKSVGITFADGIQYSFLTGWLRDSNPNRFGSNYWRTSPTTYRDLLSGSLSATKTTVTDDGDHFHLRYSDTTEDEFYSKWLYSWAPFVAKKEINPHEAPLNIPNTGSLLTDTTKHTVTPWSQMDPFEVPVYDSTVLRTDIIQQIAFYEAFMKYGVCLLQNVETADNPKSLDNLDYELYKPMVETLIDFVGKPDPHRVRKFGLRIHRTDDNTNMDYDGTNELMMHTDGVFYEGTPGYMQIGYQIMGDVHARIADGLAIANYMQQHHPQHFELLKSVPLTYARRNVLYSKDGSYHTDDNNSDLYPVESIQSTATFNYDANGIFEKVVDKEVARSCCAIPYDVYDEYIAARHYWLELSNHSKFVKEIPFPKGSVLCWNNWRLLHDRPNIPEQMERMTAYCYINKSVVHEKYRQLRQSKAIIDDSNLDHKMLSPMPNQVLARYLAL